MLRLSSAAVIISSVLLLIFLDFQYPLLNVPGLWLVPAMVFFVAGTAWEFGMLASKSIDIRSRDVTFLCIVMLLIGSVPLVYHCWVGSPYPQNSLVNTVGWIAVACLANCGFAAWFALQGFSKEPAQMIAKWSVLTLIPIYTAGCGLFWVALRTTGRPDHALWTLIGIVAVTKLTDAAAYFVGRSLGRTKLWPEVSPGKTVEGAVGGFLIGIVASMVYFHLFLPRMLTIEDQANHGMLVWWGPAVIGLLLGVVGLVGDLVESAVKRSVNAKDSGNLLPGLGGVWDVTDSLLPTTFVGYLGVQLGWI